jgi:uncharacterized membrane protein YfcA
MTKAMYTGIIVGVIVGSLISAWTIQGYLTRRENRGDDEGQRTVPTLWIALIGAILGGALGGFIGNMFDKENFENFELKDEEKKKKRKKIC